MQNMYKLIVLITAVAHFFQLWFPLFFAENSLIFIIILLAFQLFFTGFFSEIDENPAIFSGFSLFFFKPDFSPDWPSSRFSPDFQLKKYNCESSLYI